MYTMLQQQLKKVIHIKFCLQKILEEANLSLY